VRDARREGPEIEDKPDQKKARQAAQARDVARAELMQLYRIARKARQLDQLPFDVRFFVEDLIRANGGKLPELRLPPGRPRSWHKMMVIHLAVLEELEALGPGHGNKMKAIKAVAQRFNKRWEDVRDIFYNRHPDWSEAVRLSIALRHAGQEITREKLEEYLVLFTTRGFSLGDDSS